MADKAKENPAVHGVFPDKGAQTTAEEQREIPELLKAERYQAEHVLLATGTEDSSVAALQRAIDKGARQSWRLVGVSQDPTRQGGVFLIWDTSGGFAQTSG